MSTIKTNKVVHLSSSTDNLTLANNGNVTVGADLIATKQNGCQRIVLETVAYPCDGGTYAYSGGNITAPDVTAMVKPGTSYEDVAGSVVTYTPPTGTKTVVYEYTFSVGSSDSHGILHFRASIGGTEIGYHRWTSSSDNRMSGMHTLKLVIPIGGTADTNTGRQATWTSGKELKVLARNYHANNEAKLYSTYYYDGGTTSTFCQPNVQITAIG